MGKYCDIYALAVKTKGAVPADPKHWVVMVKEGKQEPWCFMRAGFVTRDEAMSWCRALVNDYEDATEIFAYELDKNEYLREKNRIKKGA